MRATDKHSVLIVDDEPANIIAITRILTPEYAIFAAKNGQDALQLARENPPDVILLDILMPEMDGYEVLAALKESDETQSIPVIIVTGLDNDEDEEKGLGMGAADYISKPFHASIVKLRVQNQIKMIDQISTIERLSIMRVEDEKKRIRSELQIAKRIQESLLPRVFPPFPERNEFSLYALMTPAREVGGDFYDFFFVDEHTLALVIADASGKGISAALFSLIAKTHIKNFALLGKSPRDVFRAVNDLLCENNSDMMFVTAFLGFFNIKEGRFLYVNAGHNPPLVKVSSEEYQYLPPTRSPMLAVFEGTCYHQEEIVLTAGDSLFLYTDGVSEAMNTRGEMYSEQRLLQATNRYRDSGPEEFLTSLKEELDRFTDGEEQSDDITMLAFTVC